MTAKDRARTLVIQYRNDSLPYDIEQFITLAIQDAEKAAADEATEAERERPICDCHNWDSAEELHKYLLAVEKQRDQLEAELNKAMKPLEDLLESSPNAPSDAFLQQQWGEWIGWYLRWREKWEALRKDKT